MGFKFKPWMKIGRHYTPRRGDPGYEEYEAGDYRGAKRAAMGKKPVAAPKPEPEPEPKPTVVEKTVEGAVEAASTTADVAKAVATAPVKVAGAVAGAAVDGTKAAAGVAVAGAGMALSGAEAVATAPVRAAKAATRGWRKKPKGPKRDGNGQFVKDAPTETLAPEPVKKMGGGGMLSGYECDYCGKRYRLERYFLPHLQKCALNPANIGGG
jgi:hypothetical protein